MNNQFPTSDDAATPGIDFLKNRSVDFWQRLESVIDSPDFGRLQAWRVIPGQPHQPVYSSSDPITREEFAETHEAGVYRFRVYRNDGKPWFSINSYPIAGTTPRAPASFAHRDAVQVAQQSVVEGLQRQIAELQGQLAASRAPSYQPPIRPQTIEEIYQRIRDEKERERQHDREIAEYRAKTEALERRIAELANAGSVKAPVDVNMQLVNLLMQNMQKQSEVVAAKSTGEDEIERIRRLKSLIEEFSPDSVPVKNDKGLLEIAKAVAEPLSGVISTLGGRWLEMKRVKQLDEIEERRAQRQMRLAHAKAEGIQLPPLESAPAPEPAPASARALESAPAPATTGEAEVKRERPLRAFFTALLPCLDKQTDPRAGLLAAFQATVRAHGVEVADLAISELCEWSEVEYFDEAGEPIEAEVQPLLAFIKKQLSFVEAAGLGHYLKSKPEMLRHALVCIGELGTIFDEASEGQESGQQFIQQAFSVAS